MWDKLFEHAIGQFIRQGTLTIEMPGGAALMFGDGTGTPVCVQLRDENLPRRILFNPDLAVGEAYTDGTLTITDDNLYGFLELAIGNLAAGHMFLTQRLMAKLRVALRGLAQYNPIGRAERNVAYHYDLSGALYDLFLDQDKQYSCGYFRDPSDSLEAAQISKKRHIAGKLLLEPDMRVLDIGCGWGGMAITLAREYGVRVLGVTLSREQHRVATERVAATGLSDRIEIRLTDYRKVTERFDRIVSVGMFEHVGAPHFREYFRHLRRMLLPGGVALVHTIGRSQPPGVTSQWISRYIFPGGYIPALSETAAAIEKEDLWTTDVEVWRLHYAETLRHWHQRFTDRIDEARALYDDRFCRMWRYYLLASELTFRRNHQCVFQFQLAREQEAVPLTREYLYPADPARSRRSLEAAE